jgi:hypothetical protein
MAGLSLYFHASLYVFKVPAVTAITAAFSERVKNPDSRVSWDPVQEVLVIIAVSA